MSVKISEEYAQLCVWQGTTLDDSNPSELVDFFKSEFDTRIKFCEEVITQPDIDDKGEYIDGTGGRCDLLFFVHSDDIPKFAIPRLRIGIRWWEDVVSYNNNSHLYTDDILKKYPVNW